MTERSNYHWRVQLFLLSFSTVDSFFFTIIITRPFDESLSERLNQHTTRVCQLTAPALTLSLSHTHTVRVYFSPLFQRVNGSKAPTLSLSFSHVSFRANFANDSSHTIKVEKKRLIVPMESERQKEKKRYFAHFFRHSLCASLSPRVVVQNEHLVAD